MASVKTGTGGCGLKYVQYSLYGFSGSSRHSRNGYVGRSENAAFDDCGRLGRLSRTDGSIFAAFPVRRSGSKCESTISSPPFAPKLGGSATLIRMWLASPYTVSRYQTSMPGAL